MDQDSLNSLLGGTQNSQSQASDQLQHTLTAIQPQLQLFLIISTILTVIICIAFLVNAIYKMRVERAILRIDKNLEKLVKHQVPVPVVEEASSEPEPVSEAPQEDIEQK